MTHWIRIVNLSCLESYFLSLRAYLFFLSGIFLHFWIFDMRYEFINFIYDICSCLFLFVSLLLNELWIFWFVEARGILKLFYFSFSQTPIFCNCKWSSFHEPLRVEVAEIWVRACFQELWCHLNFQLHFQPEFWLKFLKNSAVIGCICH